MSFEYPISNWYIEMIGLFQSRGQHTAAELRQAFPTRSSMSVNGLLAAGVTNKMLVKTGRRRDADGIYRNVWDLKRRGDNA